ncbi:hypothetical protein VTO42DRAFT_2424 [Malbranchea cinnamomea]
MMRNHQPPSPPLSTDGSLKRSFSEVSSASNELSFLHGQLTPETSFGYPESDHKSYMMDINTDPASSSALEQYQALRVQTAVSQSDYSQLGSVSQLPFARASQVETTITKVEEVEMADHPLPPNGSSLPGQAQELPRPRVVRPPRARKRARAPKTDRNEWKMNAPLSELVKNFMDEGFKSTEKFVNRPIEERMEEVARRKGEIPRPMNSFMLYRRAFADRTKELCLQNNHQVVSIATGESWRLEPQEIRDFFDKMAHIERENHKKAHPGYKFAPNKNTPKKRRKQEKDEDDADAFDPDDSKPTKNKVNDSVNDSSFHSRTSTPIEHDGSYCSYESRTPTPLNQARDGLYQNPDTNRSSWAMNNPGRPVPKMISSSENTHYYQPSVHVNTIGPNIIKVEDVTYRRMNFPGSGSELDTAGGLTGLPGTHHELLRPQSAHGQQSTVSIDGIQVDPRLLEFNGMSHAESEQYSAAQQQLDLWQVPQENQHYTHSTANTLRGNEAGESFHTQPAYHHMFPATMDGREMWADEQAGTGTTVFEDWLNGQPAY